MIAAARHAAISPSPTNVPDPGRFEQRVHCSLEREGAATAIAAGRLRKAKWNPQWKGPPTVASEQWPPRGRQGRKSGNTSTSLTGTASAINIANSMPDMSTVFNLSDSISTTWQRPCPELAGLRPGGRRVANAGVRNRSTSNVDQLMEAKSIDLSSGHTSSRWRSPPPSETGLGGRASSLSLGATTRKADGPDGIVKSRACGEGPRRVLQLQHQLDGCCSAVLP
eukprot:CAMPEP_0175795294 /NCGR_PEP_ID=MMETSP0097-20121207/84397_1 /TAXON_ID=311494 /ORGANISM="Alexandrium monilatum, Strain CCMP3105" /LENGTH=223 /DNA_ID=CAMNT_0017106487 /DNA_START=62 /DNA_END=730 /DNA_ORIENTATION=-